MSASLGRVTARLAEPAEASGPDLIRLINENINPPDPITEDGVYIRAMYVTSDQVNSFGGRFPASEQPRLAELMIDSPVMVGHRKDKLPIGRTFHATVVERDGLSWVKAYFYWLRSAEGSASLAENIDGGIYKECSVGFTFMLPECSICGKDIRRCNHEPFQQYDQAGEQASCHYNYRKLERVLETSLVYRGAAPGTSVTRELKLDEIVQPGPVELSDLSYLPDADQYLIMPNYEGIEVMVAAEGSRLSIAQANARSGALPDNNDPGISSCTGRGLLVGYRGKERRSIDELAAFLSEHTGPVSRVELKLFPSEQSERLLTLGPPDDITVHAIRHQKCDRHNLPQAAAGLATREGIRILPSDSVDAAPCYVVRTPVRPATDRTYRLQMLGNDRALLTLIEQDRERGMLIRQFSQARLMKGARFVAEVISDNYSPATGSGRTVGGGVLSLTKQDESFVMELTGALCGRFALQPVRLHGRERLLFYRLIDR